MLSIFGDKIPLVFIELLKFRLYLALDGKEYIKCGRERSDADKKAAFSSCN